MRKLKLFVMVAVLFAAITACEKDKQENRPQSDEKFDPNQGQVIEGQYIVVLKDGYQSLKSLEKLSYTESMEAMKAHAISMLSDHGIKNAEIDRTYARALRGFTVKLLSEEMKKLEADSRVAFIEPDQMITLDDEMEDENPPQLKAAKAQYIPYGVTRVGYASGYGRTVWVIDSGIDYYHPDLNVDTYRGRSFVGTSTANDDHGHGTHCAGVIAAKNNSIGVLGVAYDATVVPIKVLSSSGSGSISGIVAGVDYVASAAGSGNVANMSLGGGVSTALDNAVYNASLYGIYFAIAAGNDSYDANYYSPARVNGSRIYTVSAMDWNDSFASFSNYGNPPVDVCAPGVSIYSTYLGGSYTTMSGTSMAAPHVAGILALRGYVNTSGYVLNDPDGYADPIAHY